MANKADVSLFIGCGGGASLAITQGDDLLAVQEYAPGLHCRVNFGPITVKRIEELQSYLERLKIHAKDYVAG